MSGLIHIYTGEGKGKTTAAVGLSIRFLGNGGTVLFTQFLKDGSSSELAVLKSLPGVEVFSCTEKLGFVFRMNAQQKSHAAECCQHYLETILEKARSGQYGLLVLDELIGAWNYGLVDRQMFLTFLREKPDTLEVVMTGRAPADELVDVADYVSEIRKEKHPYDQGILARKGIEL